MSGRGAAAAVAMALSLAALLCPHAQAASQYQSFGVAVYAPIAATDRMADPHWLASSWAQLTSQVKVDKIYIETFRSRRFANEESLEPIKKFFADRGVSIAGGMALDGGSINGQFQSPCYTNPADRAMVQRASQLTARHFDDIILDDFFFNTTKTASDVAAKGNQSWTEFRLKLMDQAARELVLGAARAVNPKVKITIKFPNWYEHFAGLGYDLDQEPRLFDRIYTGTETRDPFFTEQHLQPYESYEIVRYFDNIAPGHNGGGWVDHYDFHSVDRYAEQLWDTALAKAPQVMLFNYLSLLQPLAPGDRSGWEKLHTSFDYNQMLRGMSADLAKPHHPSNATAAGYALRQIDPIIARLGQPIGIRSYRPYHATGEDFLHNFLGMIGLPIDVDPDLAATATTTPTTGAMARADSMLILTAAAADDPQIVPKIKERLTRGDSVLITTGLLRALQGRGQPGDRIEDIAEIAVTDQKALVTQFEGPGGRLIGQTTLNPGILIPQVHFLTNDAWMLVEGIANGNGFPLLLNDRYGDGMLYVLTIPDNFTDLYRLPPQVLAAIRRVVMRDFPVRVDAPAGVSLFAYDNDTFVVESYLDTPVELTAAVIQPVRQLRNLATGAAIAPQPEDAMAASLRRPGHTGDFPRRQFLVPLAPHSYEAWAVER